MAPDTGSSLAHIRTIYVLLKINKLSTSKLSRMNEPIIDYEMLKSIVKIQLF